MSEHRHRVVVTREDGSWPEAAFAAAGSKDKTLRVFTVEEGGSEHVNVDDPGPARQLIVDWFAERLGTLRRPSAGGDVRVRYPCWQVLSVVRGRPG